MITDASTLFYLKSGTLIKQKSMGADLGSVPMEVKVTVCRVQGPVVLEEKRMLLPALQSVGLPVLKLCLCR